MSKYTKGLLSSTTVIDERKKKDKFIPITATSGENRPGVEIQPERIINQENDSKLKSGDRIVHKSKNGSSGRSLYSDPNFWN